MVGSLLLFTRFVGCSRQVKLAVTQHTIGSIGSEAEITTDKDLVFVLDALKEEPAKKKRKKSKDDSKCTAKSFGALVNISKLKNAARLITSWRVRLP